MIKKNILFIGFFILIISSGLISAGCSPPYSLKCGGNQGEGNQVMYCSVSGEWTLSFSCFGSKPICSFGICISQEEAGTIIKGFGESKYIDFGISLMNLIGGQIIGTKDGIKYDKIGEDQNHFTITGEDASLNIQGSEFKNILPTDQSGLSSFIEVNSLGNITKADFAVGENGGDYSINGINFHAPGNSRVYYDSETGFKLSEGTKITSIKKIDGQKISGTNINFLDELNLNGGLEINKDGYLINKGKATYEGMSIDSGSDSVLIFKTSGRESDYKGSWIKKTSDGLEIQSVKGRDINIEFLKDNKIFDVGENGKLNMKISDGDNIKIEKTLGIISNIFHKGNGSTAIWDDGLFLSLNKDGMARVSASAISVEDILSKKYISVPCVINSENFKEEIRIDSEGKLAGILVNKIGESIEEKTIYELKNTLLTLEHEELEELAKTIKENVKLESRGDYSLYLAQEFIGLTNENGFNKEESLDLITKIITTSGDNSDLALDGIAGGIEGYLSSLDKKLSPQEIADFALENLKEIKLNTKDRDAYADKIIGSYRILGSGLKENKDFELTKDFISKVISKVINKGEIDYFNDGIREYDGTNFEEIKNGVGIATKYLVYEDKKTIISAIPTFLDFDYSKIKDRGSLGKEYGFALNEYFKNKDPISSWESQLASTGINAMHDAEATLDGSDTIRNTIVDNLGFKAKYSMIANSQGTDDLYTSTFEKIYETLPKDNLVEQINEIDGEGKYLMGFITELSSRGKLPEVFEKNPSFYGEVIEKAFDTHNQNVLYDNTMFMGETIEEIYNNDKYLVEKERLEKLFLEKYAKAKTAEEKATYTYLLKLNQNPLKDETRNFLRDFPDIPSASLPEKLDDKIALKSYYFDDERSYEDSVANYKSYGMTEEYNNGHEARLTQEINGITMIIDLEKNSVTLDSVPNVKEVVEGQFYDGIGIRTHSYNKAKILGGLTSDSAKIIYDGSCGGYTGSPDTQKNFPNSYIISDQNIGRGMVTDKLSYETLKNIAKGKRNFKDIKPASAEAEGLIFPDKGNLQKYINLLINK